MKVDVQGLTLKYGDAVAVSNLDLTVGDGESLVLLGQSGCGKTSTMRCIAGLETPTSGVISIGDQAVFDSANGVNRAPHTRNVGMVFQSYAIWPHMTVFDNVAFPLKMKRRKKAEIRAVVTETLDLVGLAHLADRGASLLSGGQMQRVALARSLAMQPSVLLLDEPLSNLDARLRHRLRLELRELQVRLGLTSVYVTHDQDEAMALADRIALMQHGRIVQVGKPEEIYAHPKNASIAEFLGVDNLLPVTRSDTTSVQLTATGQTLKVEPYQGDGGPLRACIRAEDVQISREPTGDANTLRGTIVSRAFQGSVVAYRVRISDGVEIDAVLMKSAGHSFSINNQVSVSLPPDAIQVLPLEAS
ncbi:MULTISPECIES: ABC transporter ATP-binding protein [unclassified Micromonospora]